MTDEPQTDDPQPVEPTPTKADRPMLWRLQHLIPVVAVVLTLIFGATGVYFHYFAGHQARLDIQLLTEAVIADLARGPSEQLKLTFDEEQIERASLVSLLVTNSGNLDLVPINHEDLSDRRNARITIEFPDGSRILEASVQPTGDDKSTELAQTPTNDPKNATFVVLLMNETAEAQIDLIVADYRGNRAVRATPLGKGITGRFEMESEPSAIMPVLGRTVGAIWIIVVICFFGLVLIRNLFEWRAGGHPLLKRSELMKTLGMAVGMALGVVGMMLGGMFLWWLFQ